MRRGEVAIVSIAAALVLAFAAGLRAGAFPLGVRGEWEWLRLAVAPSAVDVAIAGLGIVGYALVAALGMKALLARATPPREAVAVAFLTLAAVAVQLVAHSGAPDGYGLAKWMIALSQPGSSGYFTVAKAQARDPRAFLAGYPEWIKKQDALHIGTHPPGLILFESCLLRAMERSPGLSRFVVAHMPDSVDRAFRLFDPTFPTSRADRAALTLTGFLTLLACASTVVPLYALGRAYLDALPAWAAAALWPVVPAAVMFQPAADTAFPLISTTALALAAHAARPIRLRRSLILAGLSGLLLGIGMQFTLAFLPVGLIVAIVLLKKPDDSPGSRPLETLAATGFGFLAVTLAWWAITRADPFVVWWWNQKNHARFYAEYHRSYRAWLVANPLELAVALGLPATLWSILGGAKAPRVSLATAFVLLTLTLSGKSLSEVARLWLPFMPALLVAAGAGFGRFGGPKSLAATVMLIGVQTLVLEATIQVVYPI